MTVDDNYKYQICQFVDIVDPPDPKWGGGGQGVPKNLTVQDSAVLHGFHGFFSIATMRPVACYLPNADFLTFGKPLEEQSFCGIGKRHDLFPCFSTYDDSS